MSPPRQRQAALRGPGEPRLAARWYHQHHVQRTGGFRPRRTLPRTCATKACGSQGGDQSCPSRNESSQLFSYSPDDLLDTLLYRTPRSIALRRWRWAGRTAVSLTQSSRHSYVVGSGKVLKRACSTERGCRSSSLRHLFCIVRTIRPPRPRYNTGECRITANNFSRRDPW